MAHDVTTGPAVRLREVDPGDIAIFHAHQADPEAVRMAVFATRDPAAHDAHWRRILADPAGRARTVLVDGAVAGNVVSFPFEGGRHVGYWLGREFWGRGVATRAVAGFLAFERERPLFARAAKHNVGSRRVLEKCGFRIVGEGPGPALDGHPATEDWIFRLDAPAPADGALP